MSTPHGHGRFLAGIGARAASRLTAWSGLISGCLLLAPTGLLAQSQRAADATSPAGAYYSHYHASQQSGSAPRLHHRLPRAEESNTGAVHAAGAWSESQTRPVIQQVQNSPESARAVHHLIEALPTSQEDLDVIERRSQMMITKANIVRMAIADQAILDVAQYSPREISIIGLTRGSTTLTLWFEGHEQPLIYLVKVIRDPNLDDQRRIDYGRLERKLAVLFPNSKVYLIPMSFKIIVRGQARDQEEAANILNIIRGEVINQEGALWGNGNGFGPGYGTGAAGGLGPGGYGSDALGGGWGNNLYAGFIVNELRVPGEYQINLRWRVAELNRSQARNLGVDLAVLFNGRHLVGSAMGGVPSTLFGVFENGEVSVFVNWMATNGTAKILTEPNVTVLSGRPARFLSGGEFAVPTVVGIAGAAGQTTTFRGFGTSVIVTPTVLERDLIRLSTVAEFSQLNTGNSVSGIPGLDTRRVETTVELREGQTLALGGLLSHTEVTEISRIPYLGDIPKIGPLLFSNKRSAMDETELLILVTPEIVRPMDPHEVPPVPGFETTYPTDHEFYKYNMTEGLPDTGYYQVPPYGSGSVGTNVGYQHFNPGPANSLYSPVPTQGGYTPLPVNGVIDNGQIINGPTPMMAPPQMPSQPQQQMTPPPPAPGTEVMPTPLGTQYQPAQRPQAATASRRNRSNAPQTPAQSAGRIQQTGWTAPRQPAASPQAILPMNQSAPPQGNPAAAARNRRDQSRSSRY